MRYFWQLVPLLPGVRPGTGAHVLVRFWREVLPVSQSPARQRADILIVIVRGQFALAFLDLLDINCLFLN